MATVLVIDDSDFQRKWIDKTLKNLSHNMLEAGDGKAALKVMETEKPDCIIVDLNMPEMNGIEFLQHINERKISVPVIVLTADIQEETRIECERLGAAAFLKKPFKPHELEKILAECVKSDTQRGREIWT